MLVGCSDAGRALFINGCRMKAGRSCTRGCLKGYIGRKIHSHELHARVLVSAKLHSVVEYFQR